MSFGKGSGPTVRPKSLPAFGLNPNPFLPHPSSNSIPSSSFPRSIESSGWSDGQKLSYRDLDTYTPQRSTPLTPVIASRDSTAGVTVRVPRSLNPERARSPISYADVVALGNSGQNDPKNNYSNSRIDNDSHFPPLSRPPPFAPGNHQFVRTFQGHSISVQQPALGPRTLDSQAIPSANYTNFPDPQLQPPLSTYIGSQNPQHSLTKESNGQVSKRTRSPPSLFANRQENFNVARKDFRRPSISPPRLGGSHSQIHEKSVPSSVSEASISRPISSIAPKRTRSPPPSFSANETFEGNSISDVNSEHEREMLAKAKRLARFKVELSKSEQNSADVADQKASGNRHEQSVLEQKHVAGHLMDSSGNFTNGHAVSDYEGSETSKVIIGLCPDMCPESERGERERKGDLDRYERLDGDRNVTSRLLAVKKYTRTAEREASLIRPMPILEKTMDYLLTLLDHPYDDEMFLGVYNFLWDRMRAIRMDLRMQHIFNQGAITMLEQMIRLHILAMHELCEYTKGEGFSEGFDAHLNIEQMNKTSVELFQLYDDHRKKGIYVPTEKEFRGYYALLKLDKHPGYKVEPAELSLDLAKMTPEIRQTPEVLFARNVARACRTSNFIAFFRLARKATYLQACLMHAHFAKLRTQALASLHSGLQNNQGLPVSHVAKWLAMEDECIDELLEYHGFGLKAFEEPYMVKEGQFINVDNDYPTKRSKLVHTIRSGRIIEDVVLSIQPESLPVVSMNKMRKTNKHELQIVSSVENVSSVQKLDKEKRDSEAIFSPKDGKSGKALKEICAVQDIVKDGNMDNPHSSPLSFPFPNIIPKPQLPSFPFPNIIPKPQVPRIDIFTSTNSDMFVTGSPRRNLHSNVDGRPVEIDPKPAPPESSLANSFFMPPLASEAVSEHECMLIHQEYENDVHENREKCRKEEIVEAKLKLFLRLWRKRASKLRMLREQRQLASNAALDSLPLGPPIRQYKDLPGNFEKFDVDIAMRERYEKQEKSWARLNVSDIVAGTLGRRNSNAKCLCWKIALSSQINSKHEVGAAGSWLTSKLMPSSDNNVVVSSPGLTIWKKSVSSQSGIDSTCCFSVVRNTAFSSVDEVVSGTDAVLFLVSESISLEHQRVHLHNLLMLIPSGARLPLLILCGSYDKGFSSVIVNELNLTNIDKLRVSSFRIVFLIENHHTEHLRGFFSDRQLQEGLQWLASEAPSQPYVRCVKIRELVHTHLNSLSEVQNIARNSKLGPNDCISLFNQALDCSVQEISTAANSNPTGWPCPEITSLDKSCNEDRVVQRYMPTFGWSSNVKIEPIICALQNCKLPTFSDDLSWLGRGCEVGHEIENQKVQFENCLARYLTHASKMMGESLATKEAHVTVQTCAGLELCGSSYHIVPQWGMIFRRIFNWRLNGLSSREISTAYISECDHAALPNPNQGLGFEASLPSSYNLNTTCLDEMISVSCNFPLHVHSQPRPEDLRLLPQRNSNYIFHETDNLRDDENNLHLQKLPCINAPYTNGLNNAQSRTLVNEKPNKEADKLSKLLNQCNLLQDGIDKKLFLYF
ncbi:hypothetical protein Lalb_Chr15g0087191 [Lupinus albus]|uniref:PCI domain-containing protein n=1 Tax=Lupinus albus TaxID=3870 RepID=A0A6A4P7W1_LUPAL|nr:hypothetical protein Lalb_Chr15g0087191 [Lupinus albus]